MEGVTTAKQKRHNHSGEFDLLLGFATHLIDNITDNRCFRAVPN
jgi:hypothetical protein